MHMHTHMHGAAICVAGWQTFPAQAEQGEDLLPSHTVNKCPSHGLAVLFCCILDFLLVTSLIKMVPRCSDIMCS